MLSEGELEMEEQSLVRCKIGGVLFDQQSSRWLVTDLSVMGESSMSKTLPDT